MYSEGATKVAVVMLHVVGIVGWVDRSGGEREWAQDGLVEVAAVGPVAAEALVDLAVEVSVAVVLVVNGKNLLC